MWKRSSFEPYEQSWANVRLYRKNRKLPVPGEKDGWGKPLIGFAIIVLGIWAFVVWSILHFPGR